MYQSPIEIKEPADLACLIYDLETHHGDLQAVITEWILTGESNVY